MAPRGPSLRIKVIHKDCSGCLSCMTVCSMANESYASLSGARVQVELHPFEGIHRITICRQCAQAACEKACPVGAIQRQADDLLVVDHERCTAMTDGCRACIDKCPFHAMFWNAISERVMKCELCGGDPECVKACPIGALKLQVSEPKRKPSEIQGDTNGKGQDHGGQENGEP